MRYHYISLAFILSIHAIAQTAPDIEWQKSLGGSGLDAANSIRLTTDGGYIMAGLSFSNNGDVYGNHGGSDFWVVKLDVNGLVEWQHAYGGAGFDLASSIFQTADAGYIVMGESDSNNGDVSGNHGDLDVWVIKLNSTGTIEWAKSFGGSELDTGESIQQTVDGGYILSGMTKSIDGDVVGNHGGADAWIVKLDASGTVQWQKCLGGTGYDAAYSIRQTSDGGYVFAAETSSNDADVTGNHGGDGIDWWVVKLDGNGTIVWQKTLGGTGNDVARSVNQTADGGYIVTGETESNDGDVTGNHGGSDFWVVKLDETGNIQWQRCYGGSSGDYRCAVKQVIDGGYVISGPTESVDGDVTGNHGGSDAWIARLSAEGTLLWQKALGGPATDSGLAIDLTDQGGYVMAGYADANGGDVTGNHGERDCWVVKLGPDNVGIAELAPQVSFSLFPNPSTDAVHIQFNSTSSALVLMQLFDAAGKLVGAPVEERIPAGKHAMHYSTAALRAGVYELRLTTGGRTFTRSLVKL